MSSSSEENAANVKKTGEEEQAAAKVALKIQVQEIAARAKAQEKKVITLVVSDDCLSMIWTSALDHTIPAGKPLPHLLGRGKSFLHLPAELRNIVYEQHLTYIKTERTSASGAYTPFNLSLPRQENGISGIFIETVPLLGCSRQIRMEFGPMFYTHMKFVQTLTLSTTFPNAVDLEYGIERIPKEFRPYITHLRIRLKGYKEGECTSWAIKRFGALFASKNHLFRGSSVANDEVEQKKAEFMRIRVSKDEDALRVLLGTESLKVTYSREWMASRKYTVGQLLEGVSELCERLGSLGHSNFAGVQGMIGEWLDADGCRVGRPEKYDEMVDDLGTLIMH
ncbi:hypothetical protein LTR17_017465 [Elasticomyces elasticus]|nr:hypothetical protein LTR17_017465 [Elasticomyces elasticus]